MNLFILDSFFDSVSKTTLDQYSDYWESLTPKTDTDLFLRWIFAFTSIHTSWERNISAYTYLKKLDWLDNKELLMQHLVDSKAGLFNLRTKYIWNFKEDFFSNYNEYVKKDSESWVEFRNKLVIRLKGIGITKVSFTLEMCYPNKVEVTCLDTHMMKLYGMKTVSISKENTALYHRNESDWVTRSKNINSTSCITRAIYWDRLQNKSDSTYWTYVLEN